MNAEASVEPNAVQNEMVLEENLKGDYPQLFIASWTVTGFLKIPAPFSTCKGVLPVTNATFRLTANSERFGRLQVTLSTFDQLRNYPGTNEVTLYSEIPISSGVAIRMNQPDGRAFAVFLGVVIPSGGPAQLEASFSAPWTAHSGGETCFSGENTFRRRFDMVRAGKFEPYDDLIFGE